MAKQRPSHEYGEIGLAEALYDNSSEWPDELAFGRGDMLRVVDDKPAGGLAEGWWLCSDQEGRRGIAPANRLRLLHRFPFPQHRVITPRRFGDLFLYNERQGAFAEDDLFNSGFSDSYDVPSSLNRHRLFHDSEHPFPLRRTGVSGDAAGGGVVRTVPIRLEGERAKPLVTRRSPPPPPQRKYFHNFSSSGSEQEGGSSSQQEHYDSPRNLRVDSGGVRVSWRSGADSLSVRSDDKRGSNTSSLSLTPPDGSENSSSLSESSQDPYDVPSLLSKNATGGSEKRSAVSAPAYNLAPLKEGPGKVSSSVILNVLGNLYDVPQKEGTFKSTSTLCEDSVSETGTLKKLPQEAKGNNTSNSTQSATSGSSGYGTEQLPSDFERLSVSSLDSKDSEYQILVDGAKELNVSAEDGLELIRNALEDVESTINLLITFPMNSQWRKRSILQDTLPDIRRTVLGVCRALDSFLDVTTGALRNLSRGKTASKAIVSKRLVHILRPLKDSQRILDDLRKDLSRIGWSFATLSRENSVGNDCLDQFVAVSKQIPEDCRQVSAFLQGNADTVFGEPGKETPEIQVNGVPEGRVVEEHELDSEGWSEEERDLFEDYDFIDGNGTAAAEKSREVSVTPTAEQLQQSPVTELQLIHSDDKQILEFYASQVDAHMECLSSAIEDFLTVVEENQVPQVFVGRSKLVILAAHKLVYIGDSISQCLRSPQPAAQTKCASDNLCQVLKNCVKTTKQAAANYPTVSSIQQMVDSMVNVSHVAHDLKLLIRHMSSS